MAMNPRGSSSTQFTPEDEFSSVPPNGVNVAGRPANENDAATAMMIRRLRRPPSYDVIYMAMLIAFVWVIGSFWISREAFIGPQPSTAAQFVQALALVFLPSIGILIIAYFLWRTQQLRQVSEILMQQTMRLLRPQEVSAEGFNSVAENVRQGVDVLVGSVEHAVQRASELEEIVNKEISAVERAFGSNEERIRSLVNGLETQRAALQQTSGLVAADAVPMLQRIETNTLNLNQAVNMAVSAFGQIEDGLKTSAGDLSRTMETVSARAAETSRELDGHAVQFERISTMMAADFRGLSGNMQDYLQSLSTTANSLGGEVRKYNSEMREMEANLTQALAESTGRIAQSNQQAGEMVMQMSQEVVGRLEGHGERFTAELQTIEQSLSTRMSQTTARIADSNAEAGETISHLSDQLEQRLDGHGDRLIQIFESATSNIFDDLGKARDAFADGLAQTTLQITGRFDQESGELITRIDNAAAEFRAAADANAEKMQEASAKFSEHMAGSQSILANQLLDAANAMDQRIEAASIKMTGKLEAAGTRISERLEDVASLVDRSIDKYNNEMEHMLASRRDALEGLVSDASRRANEMDKAMAAFMGNVEEGLTAAETRARQIARIVSEQSEASLGNLEDQLRKLETNSSGQVTQAARALREQHEKALANMQEMLSSSATEFQQTAQDMRLTAEKVVRDIDAARDELRKAMIAMPEDTRNNADAMRKVVAEQIGALAALSEAVRRQGAAMDYSAPGVSMARDLQVFSNTPATTSRLAKPLIEAEPAKPSASKLAQLAREVKQVQGKLNAAAREVVEAIDGELPSDLEKRYEDKDQGVYVARLYASRSRKLIKTLESRFTEERLLRNRIQAYNRLFEKLLDDISETQGADQVLEQVIDSEQGRIYVMFAEIAGRMPTQA